MSKLEIHRLIKPEGVFCLHIDYHASHYLKVILDEIFGYSNFINEVTWRRKSGSNSASRTPKNMPNNTDTLLFFSKGSTFKFNPQYTPYPEGFREKYYNKVDDSGRYYKIDNLGAPSYSPTLIFDYKGFKTPKNGWRWTKDRMKQADKDGKLHFCFNGSDKGSIKQKIYFDEMHGLPVENLWDDIPPLTAGDKERTGWPTQKPVRLLERIIKMFTNEGDTVFDCFAGCGTAMHASHNLKRKWVGIDISPTAMKVNKKRLEELGAKVNVIDENDMGLKDFDQAV